MTPPGCEAIREPTPAAPAPPGQDVRRFDLLGVRVSAISLAEAVARIEGWIRSARSDGNCRYVCVTSVHGVMESQHDASLRAIHNRAGMVTPDGMPLVWIGKALGHRHMTRVYGPDLMLALCARSLESGYRHFLYGGNINVADQLALKLEEQFPGINVVGRQTPPFRPLTAEERAADIDLINRARPDIVWVGLSTPKQERWMAELAAHLHAPVLIGVGAAFDFLSGRKPQAPQWVQRSGFEWLFRLACEPSRLWRRYLTNNTLFLGLLVLQGAGSICMQLRQAKSLSRKS